MRKLLVTAIMVLVGLSNGFVLARQNNLTPVYTDSGLILDSVLWPGTEQKLVIGSPLWLVSTEDDGMISSVDFVRAGGSDSKPVFKHKNRKVAMVKVVNDFVGVLRKIILKDEK